MSKERLIKSIREIPDFPIPGILFYDVTTLFKDAACLQELSDVMYEMYKDKGITKVVGIESCDPFKRRIHPNTQARQTSCGNHRRELR